MRLGQPGAIAGDTAVRFDKPTAEIDLRTTDPIGMTGPATLEWWARIDPDDRPRNTRDLDGRIRIANSHLWVIRTDRDGHLIYGQGRFRLATTVTLEDRRSTSIGSEHSPTAEPSDPRW